MSFHFADIARHAADDGVITADEIGQLRRAGWADGRMTRAEAEAVFRAAHAIEHPSAEWSDFFVEAIQNFVLEGSEPAGYASEEEARWLIAQVEANGAVCSMTELELLARIIERAENVPEALKAYALGVLEREVLTGIGPTRCGGALCATSVTEAECRIIRRVIFGQASDRPAAVSRREAEMLFRIKDATLEQDNAPEFKRLFVQGVGNYLLGYASGQAQITRERALELEAFVADNRVRVGRFMGRMAKSSPNVFGMVFGRRQTGPDRAAQLAQAEAITVVEQDWLDAMIEANGAVDAYDQALIRFLAEEAHHP